MLPWMCRDIRPNSTKFLCSRSHSRSRKMSYRGRYRSRSRSRSPKRYKSRYSHSRSRSYSPRGKYYGYSDRRKEFYRSHSRSPMSSRRRHVGSRVSLTNFGNYLLHWSVCSKYFTDLFAFQDNPQPSRCLGIFGLSIYTTEQQLHHIMSKYGPVERVQVVIDAKVSNVPYSLNCMSHRCRMAVLLWWMQEQWNTAIWTIGWKVFYNLVMGVSRMFWFIELEALLTCDACL
jgi:transformer-2 protein